MSSKSDKPTILLVPGSFSKPSFYFPLQDELNALGLEVVIVPLLSAGKRDPLPPATMEDDATQIHSKAAELIAQGKEIILLMHSYGGVPGTESTKGLLQKDLKEQGKPGGIIRLVYLSALLPLVGEAAAENLSGSLPDYVHMEENGAYMYQDTDVAVVAILSGLPGEEAIKYADQIDVHSAISFAGKLSYAPFKHVPITYLFCSEDKVVLPETQQKMISKVEKDAGVKFDVRTLPTDHCPNASAPEILVKELLKIANGEA